MKIIDFDTHYIYKPFLISVNWAWEISAFILLPLIIYFLMFISLGIQFSELFKLPEWMFISIILYGDTFRKSIHELQKKLIQILKQLRQYLFLF